MEASAAAQRVLLHPRAHMSVAERMLDVACNITGAHAGCMEILLEQLPYWRETSAPIHTPYTYRVDDAVIRGSRPTVDKLQALHAGGCRRTINLCTEMLDGDDELVAQSSSPGMSAIHIPVVDNVPPTERQVEQFLAAVTEPGPAYVHCEAGVGRTGVMVACYRIASGWSPREALAEARNFGCTMPAQLAFIERYERRSRLRPSAPPTPHLLHQDRAAHADLAGLERALRPLAA